MKRTTQVFLLACVVFASSGCVQSDAMVCSNGIICPPGTVCSPTGVCINGAGCGDGRWDVDNPDSTRRELCDASDPTYVATGGTCSVDCLSNQVCLNGYIDLEREEECDDGVHPFLDSMSVGRVAGLSGDGCGSTCLQEAPYWTSLTPASPVARTNFALAYDSARGNAILFGGLNASGQKLDDTWLWTGTGWRQVATPTPPPARSSLAMAYDAARDVTIAFGGDSDGDAPGTWAWNGARWQRLLPANSPPPALKNHAMAYDHARGEIVLFGGDFSGKRNQTWTWDGSDWQNRTPSPLPGVWPPTMDLMTLAYDFKRGQVILFGGADQNGNAQDDTWGWDGQTWNLLATSGPSARTQTAMAFQAGLNRLVLYGGFSGTGTTLDDTWTFTGSAWQLAAPSSDPGIRSRHAMVFDSARNVVVFFGGHDTVSAKGDTWTFDGSDWLAMPKDLPSPRVGHVMAYDSHRGVIVLFGGNDSGGFYDDTWEWDGARWKNIDILFPPPGRSNHAMAFDPVRGVMVMSGGIGDSGLFPFDTYEYDGSDWSQPNASEIPSDRQGHGMVFDAHRQKMVLYGGLNVFSSALLDLWQWETDAGNPLNPRWVEIPQTSPSPEARTDHAMSYDPVRGEIVVFGGERDNGDLLGDTWCFDSAAGTWRQGDGTGPDARTRSAMTFHPARQVAILSGGSSVNGRLSDTWEWDGSLWTRVSVPETPIVPAVAAPIRDNHALAFDPLHDELLSFGGATPSASNQQRALVYRDPIAAREACLYGKDTDGDGLVGCADPDCWGYCTPDCAPGQCETAPPCGASAVDSCRLCAEDAFACLECGDMFCDAGETVASCPGDCGLP